MKQINAVISRFNAFMDCCYDFNGFTKRKLTGRNADFNHTGFYDHGSSNQLNGSETKAVNSRAQIYWCCQAGIGAGGLVAGGWYRYGAGLDDGCWMR